MEDAKNKVVYAGFWVRFSANAFNYAPAAPEARTSHRLLRRYVLRGLE